MVLGPDKDHLQIFKCVLLITQLLRLVRRLGFVNRLNQTSLVAFVTPIDRSIFFMAFCVVTLLFRFSWGVEAFVTGRSQISSFFSL